MQKFLRSGQGEKVGKKKANFDLTRDIQSIVVPKTIRDSVVLTDQGTLFVSQAGVKDVQVKSFRSKLNQLGVLRKVKTVSGAKLSEIKNDKLQKNNRNKQRDETGTTIQDAVKLFEDAGKLKASDIHLRLHHALNYGEVFFRINGSLLPQLEYPLPYAESLCTTIYGAMIDSGDPTYTPSQYQDATISDPKKLAKGIRSIRVASGPKDNGSLMVLRLLYDDDSSDLSIEGGDKATGRARFEWLGYTTHHTNTIELMKKRPTGMNIIAGPTGSGKTTTLKHVMESIGVERPELNLLTVEDPPEYPIKGAQQLPVKSNTSGSEDIEVARAKGFGKAIRAAMRFDPDVIMVGEIRDSSSAKMALRAAMTGHQVWSTVHANSAFSIISRIADLLASNEYPEPVKTLCDMTILTGLTFQRLVKKLCSECKVPLIDHLDTLPKSLVDRLHKKVDFDKDTDISLCGDGCKKCGYTGISGRIALAEVVAPDPLLLDEIRTKGVDAGRYLWLQNYGGRTVIHHAIQLIKQGIIDPRMAEKVVGPLTMEEAFRDKELEFSEIDDLVGVDSGYSEIENV